MTENRGQKKTFKKDLDVEHLDDVQKRRLRAVRRAYRAEKVGVKDNGWTIEVTFMDGSKANFNSKLLKLKEKELQQEQ